MQKQGEIVRSGQGAQFSFAAGNRGEAKASGKDGVQFGFMRTILPTGSGMPLLHLHRSMDEAFQILEGEIEYRLGDRYVVARADDAVLIPAGVPHCFRSIGIADARVVLIASSGSAIDMIDELSRGNLMDPQWVSEVLERYDSELLEPHPHWAPGDPVTASAGRRSGEERC